MTTLTNEILIHVPRGQVWDTLADLSQLAAYDPGTKASVVVGELAAGAGAERRCEVSGGLSESAGTTRVVQVMSYELKYKAVGRALDAVMLRRK